MVDSLLLSLRSLWLILFSFLLLAGAVFVEHHEQAWPLEEPIIKFLAKITHHSLPSVTAIKMPLLRSDLAPRLVPQDVALVFRAIVNFHPCQIVVLESASDFSKESFSLLREAIERGEVEGVPVHFLTNENLFSKSTEALNNCVAPVLTPSSISDTLSRCAPSTPCSSRPSATLKTGSDIPSQKTNGFVSNIHLITLEDLLLRREERERGSILPEFDALFYGQTVLLGGPQVAEQAAVFLNQSEKKWVIVPSLRIELALLIVLLLFVLRLRQLSWIDFLLTLVGLIVCYVILDAWMLHARGVLYPSVVPCSLLLIAPIIKILSCTRSEKR